ncbi:MAG: class I SAM-dependent methyltransferase [Nanoarchaeota archaeon]
MKMVPFDIIGDIAILKFSEGTNLNEKKIIAQDFLKEFKNIKTILEKSEKIKGRLRIAKTTFIAGEDKRETIYVENNCRFKLNVDETYFSPRLANQRQKLSEDLTKRATKNKNKILVMFAGVAPFPIIIAKKMNSNGKKSEIISNEINKKASKYAEENVKLNKLENYIKVVQCDAKKLPLRLKEKNLQEEFDFIVMPRPNLKETFLDTAFKLSKAGTIFYYYGFGEKQDVFKEIKEKLENRIGRIEIEKAGEIAPYKFRWLAKFTRKLKKKDI